MFNFYQFNFVNIIITVLLSILSCVIAVESSRYIKRNNKNTKVLFYSSLLLGITFWGTHLFVSLSVHIPLSTPHYLWYFVGNLFLSTIGSYGALYMAQKTVGNQFQYLVAGICLGIVIFSADFLGFFTLFKGHIFVNAILLNLSLLITIGTAFSILRFLTQITEEDIYTFVVKWRLMGCILAGSSLGGIPYITLAAMIKYPTFPNIPNEPLLFLLPFLFMINSNLFLMLGSDLFGEKKLLKTIQRYQSLFKQNPNAILSLDLEGAIISMNKEAVNLSGYSFKEVIGKNCNVLFKEYRNSELLVYLDAMKDGKSFTLETEIKRKNGIFREVLITGAPIFSDKELIGFYAILEDITVKNQNENTIKHLAFHDELTNLPNRRAFINEMTSLSKQNDFALLYLDFDNFKRVNDSLGHSFGDKVLNAISKKLLRISETKSLYSVYRLGGDEFALLVPVMESETAAAAILMEFQTSVNIEVYDLTLSPSIGISLFSKHSDKLEDIIKYADMAMYEAKKEKLGYKLFDSTMANSLYENFNLENDLRKAVANQELMVYFQPKFNSATSECIGAEALLRWNHPGKGYIPPSIFIPLAEDTGLIREIEVFVISEVVKYIHQWKNKKLKIKKISINITKVTLYQRNFFPLVANLLKEYDVEGDCLEFEITERMLMEDEMIVNDTLIQLKELGIEISIDDFGTGYSSLSYLQHLTIDRLKIDKSFVDETKKNIGIITATSMAKSLDLKIIAEGVENINQIELLQELGCFEVQGFYYSPAIPKESYEDEILSNEIIFSV